MNESSWNDLKRMYEQHNIKVSTPAEPHNHLMKKDPKFLQWGCVVEHCNYVKSADAMDKVTAL